MALANYTDLLAAVAKWMDRTDLTATIPDFVTLAEARLARDMRLRNQVVNTALATVANQNYVTLPADWLEIENITVSSVSPPGVMSVITPEVMDTLFPSGYRTGQPYRYAPLAQKLLLGPTPDAVYTISVDYYQRLGLAASTTNWLMTYYPTVYISACLVEGFSFLQDTDRLALWQSRYKEETTALQDADDASVRSGSSMRVRAL